MNKPAQPQDVRIWIDPPSVDDRPVPGYDAWLKDELAAALAEADAGKTTSIAEVRKEFGLE